MLVGMSDLRHVKWINKTLQPRGEIKNREAEAQSTDG